MMETADILPPEENQTQEKSSAKVTRGRNWWKICFFVTLPFSIIIYFSFIYFFYSYKADDLKFSPTDIDLDKKSEDYCPAFCILGGIVSESPTIDFYYAGMSGQKWSPEDTTFFWKRDDGYVIEIKGRTVLLNERYENPKLDFESLNNEISDILLSMGFSENNENSYSYDAIDSGPLVYTLGFEEEEMKCLIEWRDFWEYHYQRPEYSEETYNSQKYSINCGAYNELDDPLNELLAAFDPEEKRGHSLGSIKGDFATGSSGDFPCCAGVSWIATKENDQWKIIYKGQEVPSCDIVDKYEIPKEIYGDCYEDRYNRRFEKFKVIPTGPPLRSPLP